MFTKIQQKIKGGIILYWGPLFEHTGVKLLANCAEILLFHDEYEEKVNEANRELFLEDRIIRKRINYVFGDFLTYNFSDHLFDSIIIIDSISSHNIKTTYTKAAYTKATYTKAWALLAPGGQIFVCGSDISTTDLKYFFDIQTNLGNLEYSCIYAKKKSGIELDHILLELIYDYRTHENLITIQQSNIDDITQDFLNSKQTLLKFREEFYTLQEIKMELDRSIDILRSKNAGLEETILTKEDAIVLLQNEIIKRGAYVDELLINIKNKDSMLEALNIKVNQTERKKNIYEKELLEYKTLYKNLFSSIEYRLGRVLCNVAKNPFLVFKYTFIFIKRLSKKVLETITKIGKSVFIIKKRFSMHPIDGISVIIPTYKEQPYFDACINSVLEQTLDKNKIEIIISVNGNNFKYYETLQKKYNNNERIKIVYTATPGPSAGRNNGFKYASKDYVYFLDDDDYLTNGYLKELASHIEEDISIIFGRLVDKYKTEISTDTYINQVLQKQKNQRKTNDYFNVGSLLSIVCAKLIKTDLLKNTFFTFNEDFLHTEDVCFWADNFHKLKDFVYCCDGNGEEALVRRIHEESVSRPSENSHFSFMINDRIAIIEYIAKNIYNLGWNTVQKRFLLTKINSQTQFMLEFYLNLDEEKKCEAIELINSSNCFFLNKGIFSQIQGIAFCHNFSPTADASAYVATKRLSEINRIINKIIKWDVISSDMNNCREKDTYFDMFYAYYVINKRVILPGPSYFNEEAQYKFGCDAFEKMKNVVAEYIYSRSMFAGSHIAAYKYKEEYPDVIWYAEISDPIFMGVDNKERPVSHEYTGDKVFLNTFWKDCELQIYEAADVIIFTNDNQREYMLSYFEDSYLRNKVMKKSIVMQQPIIDRSFCSIINYEYKMDHSKTNIGYFGSFYTNRKHSGMFELLQNDGVVLHLFVPEPSALEKVNKDRIRINPLVGHLEFLNIASKMDYLYLNDVDFEGDLNPYLPSKLADYLATGTKIIAKVNSNSVLSRFEHDALIKLKNESEFFV